MQILEVHKRGELLLRFPVTHEPVEIGRHHRCDVVIDDPGVADRQLLVMERGGTLMMLPLTGAEGQRRTPLPLPLGEIVEIGELHGLLRRDGLEGLPAKPVRLDRATEPLDAPSSWRLSLILGQGADARRVRLGGLPVSVGRDASNDLALLDRATSARHFRLEPMQGRVRLRDLDSSNGTFVNGVRVASAELHAGDVIRAGRSELRVVAEAAPEARGSGPVAVAPASHVLLAEARRFAQLPWPVLVQGESGVGKEGVASILHTDGPRRAGPLVVLNAGGVPRDLVESELFGHERGAFTGASGVRRGVFEQAHGGTLFLDEIGELPMALQTRLLRVLETGDLRRVGAEEPRTVDVRLVCATHRDLRAMVVAGQFRQDLYFRVARLILAVPPLRERPEDIGALADHFLAEVGEVLGPRELAADARSRLLSHDWPGNARELRNVLSAAAASTTARTLEWTDIDRALRLLTSSLEPPDAEQLQRVVQQHHGNYAAAARVLGMPRSTLRDRLKHLPGEPLG